MKRLIAITLAASVYVTGCATLTNEQAKINKWLSNPTNQQNVQSAAKVLAAATQLATPFVSNKDAAAALNAVSYVANAYGNNPVPSNVLQATAQNAAIAKAVTPLVTGTANSAKTTAIIDGAALILSTAATATQPQ